MAVNDVSLAPRRVWTGLTVPGKKMMAVLEPEGGLQRGRDLIALYRAGPAEALLVVATALHLLPDRGGTFGPAFRDLAKPAEPQRMYGAILTDVRDFLKHRFRAGGQASSGADADLIAELASGRLPETVQADWPGGVIRYTISSLDALSRCEAEMDTAYALGRLRDLLGRTCEVLASQEERDDYEPAMVQLRRLRGRPAGGGDPTQGDE